MRSFTLLWAGILGIRLANLKGRAEPKKRIMVSFWILIKKIGTSQIAQYIISIDMLPTVC